jgi:glycosyltransferase involved in cell wall biosynthesis
MPRVSILITVYNCERYILEAVHSALGQDFEDIEVIVIDDGSIDGTINALRSVMDERLRIFEPGRIGRSRALNFGIQNALGKYIAILDADDLALPRRVSIQMAFLQANPDVALVGSRYRTCIDGSGKAIREDIEPMDYEEIIRKFKLRQNALFHSSVMFEKEKINLICGYDVDLECLVDWDIYVRLAKFYKICNIDERLSLKRLHEQQFFAGRDGVHFRPEANYASTVIQERIRELPSAAT